MMLAVLAGFGEIGESVYNVFSKYHDIAIHDPEQGYDATGGVFDILLVAIPYSEHFCDIVADYARMFGVEGTLVFSTVPVGTCRKIGACHSPVEGKHPDLTESIRKTDKWLGGSNIYAKRFLEEADFTVRRFNNPETTEFLKIRSTTLYGLNIEFARYSKQVCDELKIEYSVVKEWDAWVNGLYATMGMPQFTRYILDPPIGAKGGHCVTANAKMLNSQYPHTLVSVVAEE